MFRNAFGRSSGWDPWRELLRLHNQMDSVFSEIPGQGADEFPPIDVWSGEAGLVLVAQVPGVATDDIEVTVVGDLLTLKGSRTEPETGNGQNFHRRERESGRFVRTVQLPYAIEAEQVKARFKNGLLQIDLPRAASERPRKIAVAAE